MRVVLPVFLVLEGRLAVVVGAGPVAERKVEALLEAGAVVRIVAPGSAPQIRRWASEGRVELVERGFEPSDIGDAWFVVACTSDPTVQAAVGRECDARRVFCLAVDDLPNASAFGGSVIRRPPLVISISSSGAAPALTRMIRTVIEHVLPPRSFVEQAKALRERWKRDGVPHDERFAQLVREALGGYVGSAK